jgi:hypothetical protein
MNDPQPAVPFVDVFPAPALSPEPDTGRATRGDATQMQEALARISRRTTHIEVAAARVAAGALADDGVRHIVWDVINGQFIPRETRELSPQAQASLSAALDALGADE